MIFLLHIIFLVLLIALWQDKPQLRIYKSKEKRGNHAVILGFIIVYLSFLAAFRPSEMPDYGSYERIFQSPDDSERIEVGFLFVIDLIQAWISRDFQVFLFIAALICISIKLLAITRLTSLLYSSLFVYVCSKYISNDLIQMRVAFSTGFLLWGLYYKYKKKLLPFFTVAFFAFLFHYSALLIFLIWFIPSKKINRYIYLILVVGSYLLALQGFSVTNLIGFVPIVGIQNLYDHYESLDDTANLFSILLLAKMAMCVYFLWNWKKYSNKSPYFVIEIQLFAISLIIYCLLFSINSIAVRLAELFQIVEIVLIPMFYYVSRNRVIGKSIITFVGSLYFVFYVYFSGWLQ